MPTEQEIKSKIKEAYKRLQNETHGPDKEYIEAIIAALEWAIGANDDPFRDLGPIEGT